MQEFHTIDEIEEVSRKLTDMMIHTYVDPESQPVLRFRTKAETIDDFFEEQPPQAGIGLAPTLDLFRERILPASVKTWHPLFLNQMFPGTPFAGIIGDLMTSMMNPTLATWEMSPVATIIERMVSQWLAGFLGMKPGSAGIFLPGGSVGNLLALAVARNNKLGPEVSIMGMSAAEGRPVILCSEAHYSISNAANLLGIGAKNVIHVETNHRNEMLIDDLRAKLEECDRKRWNPFAIVATMGLTVTGGFDPLAEIVEVCKDRDIHIHVDAAFGGGIALSKQGSKRLAGIESADTVIWDAHKWLHVPLACTALLAPDPHTFKKAFSSNAHYLYHPQEEEVNLADDLGNYTILCGKRFDALRLWLLFKAYGAAYFHDLADDRMAFTAAVAKLIGDDPELDLSYDPVTPLICFRFLTPQVARTDGVYQDKLHRWVREQFKKQGKALFNVAVLKGRVHFRMILINMLTQTSHIEPLLFDIRKMAAEFLERFPEQASGATAVPTKPGGPRI